MAYKHEKGRNAMRQVKRRQQGRLTNASSNHQSTFSKKVKKKGCGCGKKKENLLISKKSRNASGFFVANFSSGAYTIIRRGSDEFI
ncbi:hypothetical protein BKP29_0210645 [Bacillus licheniformis]|nr:hypothetical protein BKP29_0210645 [Bacillus licheniformis]